MDYRALYENERNMVLTFTELCKRYRGMFADIKQNNWEFTEEQKEWMESHLLVVDKLDKITKRELKKIKEERTIKGN